MMSRSQRSIARSTRSLLFGVGSCLLLFIACSSPEEATPTRTVIPAPVGTADGGGVATTDAASEADPSCTTAAGCFSCEPAALVEFLNACTEGQCAPFDNAARLPLYEPGKPLPAIP